MKIIEVNELKKDYYLGKTVIHALKGISFDVEKGDFISIIGPSGCGKTTLLNIVGCIDKPTEGSVVFEGIDFSSLSDNQKSESRLNKIGFIFQSFNLIPVLNIIENIEFPLILSRVSKKERRRRVEELIEIVGLSEFRKHRPEELSGGQRQRVAIARALINNPSLVIADEPTANLDSKTGKNILEAMKTLNEKKDVTFIFSTHNKDVMEYAKRKIYLKDGEITDTEEGASR